MKRCKKCGGARTSSISNIDKDDFICVCNDHLFGEIHNEISWKIESKKRDNKKNSNHWRNGREKYND